MLIVVSDASGELTVKNSRFLSEITRVDSPDEAREIWHFKKETYDNGGHIVYAFITGPQGNIMGCSDDGEPSGTAGKPTLAVLKGSGATNLLLTTARWFGGTKLGTGGLVKAYTESAQLALANCTFTELVEETEITFSSSTSAPRFMACSVRFSANAAPLMTMVPGMFSTLGEKAICPPKLFFSMTSTDLPARRA
jgi:uncharacterized YigZ family protein